LHEEEIGHEIIYPVWFQQNTCFDIHVFRERALDLLYDEGVEADLEYGSGFGFTGEFGVNDFVAPVAQLGGLVGFLQEIRPSVPLSCLRRAW
jgi:hypothetical protein